MNIIRHDKPPMNIISNREQNHSDISIKHTWNIFANYLFYSMKSQKHFGIYIYNIICILITFFHRVVSQLKWEQRQYYFPPLRLHRLLYNNNQKIIRNHTMCDIHNKYVVVTWASFSINMMAFEKCMKIIGSV